MTVVSALVIAAGIVAAAATVVVFAVGRPRPPMPPRDFHHPSNPDWAPSIDYETQATPEAFVVARAEAVIEAAYARISRGAL